MLDLQFSSRFLCGFYMFGFSSENRTLIDLFGSGRTVKHYFGRSLLSPPPPCSSDVPDFRERESLKVAQAGCQAADNCADSGVKRHRKPRKTKGWWWHGRQMTLLDLLMSFPFYFHAQGTPCCMELLLPMSNECISWRNVYPMQSLLWFSDRNSDESSYWNSWKFLL